MKNKETLILIVCILIGLGVGFFGGYKYRNYRLDKTMFNLGANGANGNFQRFTGNGTNRTMAQNGNGMMRGGAVEGTILSMDDKSVTVKLSDDSSKIILFSDSTTYSNTQVAVRGDLKIGSTVAVFGAVNSDGSVTATNVQINPMTFKPQGSPAPK
jgi:hypothetical protein